jgi:hypothetical protein
MRDDKPKRPWSGFGYTVLVVIAILAAWFVVRPVGLEVSSVFQRLSDALGGK